MSEQATMTREQLEAAGYDIEEWNEGYYHIWRVVEPQINEQPQWQISLSCHIDEDDVCQEAALIAATAHYRQQQELFNFREFLHDIDGLLDKLAFYNSNHDALDDLQILRASINIPNTWHGDAGTWNPPTVSKSERAE